MKNNTENNLEIDLFENFKKISKFIFDIIIKILDNIFIIIKKIGIKYKFIHLALLIISTLYSFYIRYFDNKNEYRVSAILFLNENMSDVFPAIIGDINSQIKSVDLDISNILDIDKSIAKSIKEIKIEQLEDSELRSNIKKKYSYIPKNESYNDFQKNVNRFISDQYIKIKLTYIVTNKNFNSKLAKVITEKIISNSEFLSKTDNVIKISKQSYLSQLKQQLELIYKLISTPSLGSSLEGNLENELFFKKDKTTLANLSIKLNNEIYNLTKSLEYSKSIEFIFPFTSPSEFDREDSINDTLIPNLLKGLIISIVISIFLEIFFTRFKIKKS